MLIVKFLFSQMPAGGGAGCGNFAAGGSQALILRHTPESGETPLAHL
jgi:hypothetical protein